MRQALRIFGLVVLTICVLSITIKNETIFAYIYDVISPATKLAQRSTISAYDFSAQKTREFTKRLFDNSVPKTDSVKSRFSSTLRKGQRVRGEPEELIETPEKDQLDDLIRDHHP